MKALQWICLVLGVFLLTTLQARAQVLPVQERDAGTSTVATFPQCGTYATNPAASPGSGRRPASAKYGAPGRSALVREGLHLDQPKRLEIPRDLRAPAFDPDTAERFGPRTPSTIRRWQSRGRQATEEYPATACPVGTPQAVVAAVGASATAVAAAEPPIPSAHSPRLPTVRQQDDEPSVFDTVLFRDGNRIVIGPGVLDQRRSFSSIALEAQIAGDVPLWGQGGVRALEEDADNEGQYRWSSQGYASIMLRLRMLATRSVPVAPPSFMPKFTYQGIGLKRTGSTRSMYIVNAVFGHHSNGQAGCPLVDQVVETVVLDGRSRERCSRLEESVANDTTLNIATGNFSTHYIRTGVYYRRIWNVGGLRAGWDDLKGPRTGWSEFFVGGRVEQHQFGMKGAIAAELVDRYGMTQIEGVAGISLGSRWIFDRVDVRMSYRHVVGDVAINRAWAGEYFLYFKKRPDIGVFFRNYTGRDYYNINFERYLRRLEIGLTFNWESILRTVPGLS